MSRTRALSFAAAFLGALFVAPSLPGQAPAGQDSATPEAATSSTAETDQIPQVVIGDPRFKHWEDMDVRVLGFSPDGQRVLSASPDGTIRSWHVASGEWRELTSESAMGACLSGDSRVLYVPDENSIRQIDPQTWREHRRIEATLTESPRTATTPDGSLLAMTVTDGESASAVVVRDVAAEVCRFRTDASSWSAVALSSDGRWLAGCTDSWAYIFDVEGRRRLHKLEHHVPGGRAHVFWVGFSPDNRRLVTADVGGNVRAWDVTSGEVEARLELSGTAQGVAWTRDGRAFAVGTESICGVWQASDEKRLWTTPLLSWSVAFSGDGQHLAVGTRHTVLILDAATGHRAEVVDEPPGVDHRSLAFSPDGRLFTGTDIGDVMVWDPASGARLDMWHAHEREITRLLVSPDGNLIATAAADGHIRLWDAATKGERFAFRGIRGTHPSIAFAPDGRTFAFRSKRVTAVELFDLPGHRHLAPLSAPGLMTMGGIMFGPDGRRLFAASDTNTVTVWDVQNHTVEQSLGGLTRGGRVPLAVSPDGAFVAARPVGHHIGVWDLATQRHIDLQHGDRQRLFGLAFHPDGNSLASSGRDGTVRLWDHRAARPIRTLKLGPAGGTIHDVAFSPDGQRLATLNGNGTVSIVELAAQSTD